MQGSFEDRVNDDDVMRVNVNFSVSFASQFAATEEEAKKSEQVTVTWVVGPQNLVAYVDVSDMLSLRDFDYIAKEKRSR